VIRITLCCDRCGTRGGDAKNDRDAVFLLRAKMKAVGWAHRNHSGKDYCPRCANLMAPTKERG
jgi:hypothetical protein